jgi:hypothetical protein
MIKPGDEVTTSALAVWFEISRDAVIKRLKRAGIEPLGRGPRGVTIWPRLAALQELYRGRDIPSE